jgi:thioredoxin reductase/CRP-like cAMP-binding protein/NAD-dependent dihydropyrimidine dehydrogenase PreA subunit
MTDSVKIAIVGSGPGGLSAAAHAAELGISHVLLERSVGIADTIQKYQKGKHVMAEPNILPLRSPLDFAANSRETILNDWQKSVKDLDVNIRYNSEVTAISGSKGNFQLTLKNSETIHAEAVIVAIGLQGNPRKLGVEGDDSSFIQYQLDDPDEYQDETIVIVGAGDAAIENAIALAERNQVYIVNRRDEFARAKEGNLNLILSAIDKQQLHCFYSTNVRAVNDQGDKAGTIKLETPTAEVPLGVDRVIARLGAIPPRKFVESCGIEFPNADINAVPALSEQYESNVKGLYIVGALAGYPLIKQAMNQGYEVVEYILGNKIEYVDNDLLQEKFNHLPYAKEFDVNAILNKFQQTVSFYQPINALKFRELILESNVHTPAAGEIVFAKNDYTNSFYTIVEGYVELAIDATSENKIRINKGQFFGEMSLISGRRRSATVYASDNCILIESPRRTINKLINSIDAVKELSDKAFILRAIHSQFAPNSKVEDLAEIVESAELRHFSSNDVLFNEGDIGDELHLVRSGSLTVSRNIGGRDVVLSYVPAGNYVGEMGLLGSSSRKATITAAVPTETVVMKSAPFLELLNRDPELKHQVQQQMQQRLTVNTQMEAAPDGGDVLSFLMTQGLGEATDVLLIDESLCVRCDNCEDACAGTHQGTSRLNREAGPTYASIHVPTSCRHCENPHCMKDCPPDAISRKPNGEVVIADNCIGCGNCEKNCPYGVIQLAYQKQTKTRLWQQLLFGKDTQVDQAEDAHKIAVKCDMCVDLKGGPSCVRACPTGAAIRISPEKFVELVKPKD